MPAMTSDEAYAILGVQKAANEIEIKTAYKRLALRTHPDKNPNDPDASKNFHRVSEAYKRITDPASFHDEDNEGENVSEAEAEMMFNMMFSEMFSGGGFGGSSSFFECDDDYMDDNDYDDDDDDARPRGWRAEEDLLRAMAMMLVGAKDCGDDDSEDEEYWDEDEDADEDEDDDDDDDEEEEIYNRICDDNKIRMMIQNLSIGQNVQKKTANDNLKSENLDTVNTVFCGGKLSGQKGKESSSRGIGRMMGGGMNEVAAMFQMMESMENTSENHSSKLGKNFKTRSKRKIDEEEEEEEDSDDDDWETASDNDDDDDEVEIEEKKKEKEDKDENKKIGVQHKPHKSSAKILKAVSSSTGSFSSTSKATVQQSMIDEDIVKGMSEACSVSEGFKVGDRVMVNSRLLFTRSITF